MGLFDDFDVNMDEVEESKGGYAEIADGIYPFEIIEGRRQDGSSNNPDLLFFVIIYDLEEAGQKQEWVVVGSGAESGDIVADDKGLGRVKSRLLSLGYAASDLNSVEAEDLAGIRGTLELKSSTSKKTRKVYQNVNIKAVITDEGDEPEPVAKPAAKAAPAAEVKQEVAAKQTARQSPGRTRVAPKASAPADDNANPFD